VALVKNRFAEMLVDANRIEAATFKCWVFCPGMQFNSPHKWWGDRGQRDFRHEGVDFCLYEDRSGQMHRLDEKTRIPVMAGGVVRAVFRDYLGQAVIVEHDDVQGGEGSYLSIYAHTHPREDLRPVLLSGQEISSPPSPTPAVPRSRSSRTCIFPSDVLRRISFIGIFSGTSCAIPIR